MNTQANTDSHESQHEVEHGPVHWTIFNPEGQIHKHAESCMCDLWSFDVSNFPKGAYMIVVEFNETKH